MSGLFRLLLLAAGFGLSVWFFQSLRPEVRPPEYQDSLTPDSDYTEDKGDTWTREERAQWRDGVNQRLQR